MLISHNFFQENKVEEFLKFPHFVELIYKIHPASGMKHVVYVLVLSFTISVTR